jgi:carbamoyl-phosphate synthase small subunit
MPTHTEPRPATSRSSTAARPLARLALADGTVFHGRAFGAMGQGLLKTAEVVFNTAISGYQESLSDPSYTGQILVQTFPLIGNTGVNDQDMESAKFQVSGFVVRELANRHSNFRASSSLEDALALAGVLAIEGIDTRALTKKLRITGSIPGALTDRPVAGPNSLSDADLIAAAKNAPSMAGQNLVPAVGCTSNQSWKDTLGEWSPSHLDSSSSLHTLVGQASGRSSTPPTSSPPRRFKVLALDCGAKRNILRNLADRGCDVTVVPHDTKADTIRSMYKSGQIDGLFISNGPGDPAAVTATVATLADLLRDPPEQTIPTFGICLGHQLLALAIGAKTYKLKFGHRGINQPILNQETGKVEITSQNHGFAVEPESLKNAGGVATHIHLNDHTLAGFRLKDRPVFSVQYHPEASPGPHDPSYLFDQFVHAMGKRRK